MVTPSRLLALTLALLLGGIRLASAAPGDAPAGAAEQEVQKERAKQHFLRGLDFARKDHNYDAALAEFLASRELFPTQVALLNAAVSLTRLGRYDEALAMYQELFELFGPGMTPQERALANEEMADLESRLGSIEVHVDVSDAVVEVDARRRGVTPLAAPLRVGPGTHVVRVSKPHFEPFEARVVVASQQQRALRVVLQPSGSLAPAPLPPAPAPAPAPPASASPRPAAFHIAAEVGVSWASTLDGGAAQACDSPPPYQGATLPGCRERKHPFGPVLRGRVGYELRPGLELDLALGYLHATEAMTRSIVASGDVGRRYGSTDYRDTTELTALTAALGLAYRVPGRFPLTFGLGLGVARATLHHANLGTFALEIEDSDPTGGVYRGEQQVSVREKAETLWLPLLAPEVRLAVRVGPKLSFDLGLGVLVLFGPSALRSGATSLSTAGERRTSLVDVPGGFENGDDVRPGVLALPQERRIGTVLAFTPTLGGRFEL